ncbi:hypothetical protein J6590_092260 [Homalodisca vitripennis]|nr:hypothetical protein J6590_092260 [Homalodisca vitripennis]
MTEVCISLRSGLGMGRPLSQYNLQLANTDSHLKNFPTRLAFTVALTLAAFLSQVVAIVMVSKEPGSDDEDAEQRGSSISSTR